MQFDTLYGYVPERTIFGDIVGERQIVHRKFRSYNLGKRQLAGAAAGGALMAYGRIRRGVKRFLRGSQPRAGGFKKRRMQTRSQTRSIRKGVSGIGVTTQYDARRVYRKRRMPRYRRKRWRRFVKKVHFVAEKDLGTQTVVFNSTQTALNSTNGDHAVFMCTLYGQQSTDSWNNDLAQISGIDNSGNPTAAAGVTVDPTSRMFFQSAVLDMTVRNSSLEGNANYQSYNRLEVDVYEISFRKVLQDSTGTYVSYGGIAGNASAATPQINGAAKPLTYNLRGVTPFEQPYLAQRWGMRIWKKTKYFLNNNEVFTYQIRDPKRRVATVKDLSEQRGFNRPGWTRCILIIAKVIPGITVGLSAGQVAETIKVGITRKYTYKVDGRGEPREYYDTL